MLRQLALTWYLLQKAIPDTVYVLASAGNEASHQVVHVQRNSPVVVHDEAALVRGHVLQALHVIACMVWVHQSSTERGACSKLWENTGIAFTQLEKVFTKLHKQRQY